FAHNEHGVKAVNDTLRAFNAGRYIVLFGQAGDRKDEEIAGLVRAVCELGPSHLLVCDLPGYERGRESGAVSKLIAEFAADEGVPKNAVSMFISPVEGVEQALREARDGDCLLLLALTQRDEVLAMIRSFVAGDVEGLE
ncbi:MAG: hypothetical protein HKP21_10590, partial [Xanthomonadales bacterium]|nr:hypothetical protein [Gammaproteobacteria bacterium]NNK04994.1 hypothetical protein [Xanthomonadales bacterium]